MVQMAVCVNWSCLIYTVWVQMYTFGWLGYWLLDLNVTTNETPQKWCGWQIQQSIEDLDGLSVNFVDGYTTSHFHLLISYQLCIILLLSSMFTQFGRWIYITKENLLEITSTQQIEYSCLVSGMCTQQSAQLPWLIIHNLQRTDTRDLK